MYIYDSASQVKEYSHDASLIFMSIIICRIKVFVYRNINEAINSIGKIVYNLACSLLFR